jgi:hypothetical protein
MALGYAPIPFIAGAASVVWYLVFTESSRHTAVALIVGSAAMLSESVSRQLPLCCATATQPAPCSNGFAGRHIAQSAMTLAATLPRALIMRHPSTWVLLLLVSWTIPPSVYVVTCTSAYQQTEVRGCGWVAEATHAVTATERMPLCLLHSCFWALL